MRLSATRRSNKVEQCLKRVLRYMSRVGVACAPKMFCRGTLYVSASSDNSSISRLTLALSAPASLVGSIPASRATSVRLLADAKRKRTSSSDIRFKQGFRTHLTLIGNINRGQSIMVEEERRTFFARRVGLR